MSSFAIYDSSVLIQLIRTGSFFEQAQSANYVLRNSSVVLAELWRGASTPIDRTVIRWMEKNFRTLTPTANNWLESGLILSKIQSDHGFEARKLRDLHFDVLIALTARSHGAQLVTSNKADFELVQRYRKFELEVW